LGSDREGVEESVPLIELIDLHDDDIERNEEDEYFVKAMETRMLTDPVANKYFHAAAVLRVKNYDDDVGLVDIYYNYRRVYTMNQKYQDIDASFDMFYFLKPVPEDGAATDRIETLALSWHEMMGDSAVQSLKLGKYTNLSEYWGRNKHFAVQKYMKLYQSYFQVKNTFLVAHDRYVSIFFLNEERFYHLKMSDEVEQMEANFFPIEEGADEDHQLNCLLVSGQMETIHLKLN